MKRLLACLLALLLPFTTCCASGLSDIVAAMQSAQATTNTAQTLEAEGINLDLTVTPAGAEATAAKGFLGIAGESLYFQADTPWLKPFTLQFHPENGLYLWDGAQWYTVTMEEVNAAAQAFSDPDALTAALEKDFELLAPVLTPAFSKLATSPAVVLAGVKFSDMMDRGVFSISGTDLNMVLYEVFMALENVDKAALSALTPKLMLGDIYLQLLEELPDILEDLAEMEFQFKGDLHDDDQGFVSLIAEDLEFTVNYHDDDNLDRFVIDGVLRIDNIPCAFELSLGDDVTLNYKAGNARGTITAMGFGLTQTYSLSGSHYTVNSNGSERLQALWSCDLLLQDNGLILAVDVDDNYRCFVDFKFQLDPTTEVLNYAHLSYKDVQQEHVVTLAALSEDSWLLGYDMYAMGKKAGSAALTATAGTAQMPVLSSSVTPVTMEQMGQLLAPAQPNP